jgi:protein gp37
MFPHDSPKWRIYQFLNVSLSRIGGPLPVHHGGPFPLPNYWAGVSVEDQPTADVRVSLLFKTPTAKRFVSYEPPLDGINFNFAIQCDHNCNEYQEDWCPGTSGLCMCQQTPNLIICGAETGPRRRMMNLDWARSVRDQCAAAGVPFWFKKDSEGNETLDGVEHKPEFWR